MAPGAPVARAARLHGRRDLRMPVRRRELRLQAVRRMEAPDLARAAALVERGAIGLAGLVTARHGLDDVGRAFERAAKRDGRKVVVEPGRD